MLSSVMAAAGCAGPRPTTAMRAIWVTRFDYRTAEDVSTVMANCADAGFNTILFQVRGNATAFYRSSFEPWADEFGGSDPGFDPLQLACDEARKRNMQLHAWVNVMPAWRGTKPPTNPQALYNRHPEWFWYDQHGNRQALCDFYVSVNPCLPEVRTYLVDVFREIVSKYAVDGLHLDYIRFPNEPPAIPAGSDIDYPRDPHTLSLFLDATGMTPESDPAAWNAWRTECVTALVGQIRRMMRETKPGAALTAAVGVVPANALRHFQDGTRWIQEGLVDTVFPMNYTDSPEVFAERLTPWMAVSQRGEVVPGLWFGRPAADEVEAGARSVCRQIEYAHAQTGGFCVFAYSSLFDSWHEDPSDVDVAQRRARQFRRDIVLPLVRRLGAGQ